MTTEHKGQPTQTTAELPETSASSARPKRRFSLRGFTSLLLTLTFLAMCFSGAMLFLTPRGRTANWTDWELLELSKHQWGAVHVNNSVLFVGIAAMHLVLNWSIFTHYLKRKASTGLHMKKELGLAAVVATVCVVGPIWGLPPFSTLMAFNEDVKNYWDQHAAQPPVPHAEELTLTQLAGTIGLSTEDVSGALQKEGYDVANAEQTVGEIAQQKSQAPSDLFAIIRARFPESRGWGRVGGSGGPGAAAGGPGHGSEQAKGNSHGKGGPGAGAGQGWGQGRQSEQASDIGQVTLSTVASAVGLTVEEVVAALRDAGLEPVDGEMTLGQFGLLQNQSAQDLLDVVRERYPNTRGWGRITGQRGGGWHE